MAKKKRKDKEPEEKYEFKPPEFDERQFLIDEMSTTKRMVLLVTYGAIFGVIAGLFTIMFKNGYLGFLVLVAGAALIRYYLQLMGIDLSKFTKKTWAESAFSFFFTFLAIWLIAVNPPFYDGVGPEINHIQLSVEVNGKFIVYNYTAGIGWQSGSSMKITAAMKSALANNTAVNITAHVADSSGLSAAPVITLTPTTPHPYSMVPRSNNTYYFLIDPLTGSYLINGQVFSFSISAVDTIDNKATFTLDKANEISAV
jgi:hypothetical protein